MNVIRPEDGMIIRESCRLAPGVHVLPSGLVVEGSGITVDGTDAVLVGGPDGTGVTLRGVQGVTLSSLRIRGYRHGVHAADCTGLTIRGCDISGTSEVPPNTVFLDIWKPAEDPYGGAVLLVRCAECTLEENLLMHQQNGLLTYHCRGLRVLRNNASYNSGFGIHLYDTCESLFEGNWADYCCRFEPREGGLHYGHMGADAAGFVAVYGSCRNTFRRNAARLGGDGFFLAGMSPDGVVRGCDHNLFEENDGSLSPNIAFEATFCSGNVFRKNYADRSNYGFWLGYSADTLLEENRMVMNRQAGIAVENGRGFRVIGNTFQANGHGILLWSGYVPTFAEALPDRPTCLEWHIEGNVFTRNARGIRVAANQDHGIRPGPPSNDERDELRPRAIRVLRNDIQDNRIGVELVRADDVLVEGNLLHRNVEANLRLDDAREVLARNNLGSAGAYL